MIVYAISVVFVVCIVGGRGDVPDADAAGLPLGAHGADRRRRSRRWCTRRPACSPWTGPAAAAVIYAVTAIVGSVLIAGGVFLLHRKDAHAFFTR